MFTTIEQVKDIIQGVLQNSGRGGFLTGVITSLSPLTIQADALEVQEKDLYITDNCIGLIMHYKHQHIDSIGGDTDERLQDDVILRRPFKVGEGVLLISRPDSVQGVKYIVVDRIQPYQKQREVSAK